VLDKFWETLGSDLAQRWLDYLFGPAFLFWVGGLGLYIWQHGWQIVLTSIQSWNTVQQVTTLIVVLLLLVFSSLVIQAVHFPILRLLEGYWPWPLNFLERGIVALSKKEFEWHYSRLRQLKGKKEALSLAEQDELTWLEMWAHRNPASVRDLLPTELGNILRASENASESKYGLEAVVCWPRLWSLLPSSEQENLTSARTALNRQAELCLWGAFFFLWTILTPWSALIALAWVILAYSVALQTASAYGDLLEASFDLHHFDLYDALAWPRPRSSTEEKAAGARLSEFLWRGTVDKKVTYSTTKKTKS
jgi:hypothetical protein